MLACARLVQLSDSALPVGAFSFSAALEAAAAAGVVTDAPSLQRYAEAVVAQTLTTDAVAALSAWRGAARADYDAALQADRAVMMIRMSGEGRLMLRRMGRRMAELGELLAPDALTARFCSDVRSGFTPGTHPVALALVAQAMKLTERMLFASLIYGAASMVTSAALRCVRVSHYDTQRILHAVVGSAMQRYADVSRLTLADMNGFSPELDVLASLHEVGSSRMFMS
jgi:urease accessory protein